MSVMRVIIAGGRLSFHPREFTDVADYSELFFQLRRPIRHQADRGRPGTVDGENGETRAVRADVIQRERADHIRKIQMKQPVNGLGVETSAGVNGGRHQIVSERGVEDFTAAEARQPAAVEICDLAPLPGNGTTKTSGRPVSYAK